MNWDQKFLRLALEIASWSRDTDTKVGSVIVGPDREIRSTGYNGFPRGINDTIPDRYLRPDKYMFTEHAERNACFNAARIGVSLKGCTLYCDSTASDENKATSCVDCARAIIQCGITRIVQRPLGSNFVKLAQEMGGWRATCYTSLQMFTEAGIILDYIQV